MADNPYRVGKTQWAKWNDAGREAYNHVRNQGLSEAAAMAEASAVTQRGEDARRDKKRGLLGALQDVREVVAEVEAVAVSVAPVVAVASTIVKAVKPKTKKGK